MMYIHYCKTCDRFHILNGHKLNCPRCKTSLSELRMPYMDYVQMSLEEREALRIQCNNDTQLKELSTIYRMYKYSKWYKDLQKSQMEYEENDSSATDCRQASLA